MNMKVAAIALSWVAVGLLCLFLVEGALFRNTDVAQFAKDISITSALASISISLAMKKE